MRLTTQSEYALICLKLLCRNDSGKPVSVTTIAEQEEMSKDYVEQLFLKLKKAGIIKSVKGAHGGYLLAKEPSQITFREVIEALEESVYETFCSPQVRERIVCKHFDLCSLRPIWHRLKVLIDDFFSRITLDVLLRDEATVHKDLIPLQAKTA
ncbi:MAG: Rrf2 family transcriptional regulator [Candidatus Omnitrophica bacterium]|nr:Rrf2 family transcriptional regulator [Candidatus Omnitrophota bacterium]